MSEKESAAKPKDQRWIVRYRRYSSDQWLEESFTNCAAAVQFKDNYLYDRGPEAQCVIRHFVSTGTGEV